MKIIAFTGAGISKESGIPTFEENQNIRTYLTRDFFNQHPSEFEEKMKPLKEMINKATPNAAHLSLAKNNIPVITMNVDDLHEKAGTKKIVKMHGTIDHPILYGDCASEYATAIEQLKKAPYKNFVFLIIGVSFYTSIANVLFELANQRAYKIVVVNDNASHKIPNIVENILNNNL